MDILSYYNDGNVNFRIVWRPEAAMDDLYVGCTVFYTDGSYRDISPNLISGMWDVWNAGQFVVNQTYENAFNIQPEELQKASRIVIAVWNGSPSPSATRLGTMDVSVIMLQNMMRDSWVEDVADTAKKTGENVSSIGGSLTDFGKILPYAALAVGAYLLLKRVGKK